MVFLKTFLVVFPSMSCPLHLPNAVKYNLVIHRTRRQRCSYGPCKHNQALVVKSISFAGLKPPSTAFSHVQPPIWEHVSTTSPGGSVVYDAANVPAGREPHAHFSPETVAFSVVARSQVHSPAGLARHEQRGPLSLFSSEALAQLQLRADCLPHEQVAC
jgi:hypothetical protein